MKKNGFSFLELIIAISIVAILATLANSTYKNYIVKTRRTEGIIALTQLQGLLEKYYTVNNTYATATIGTHNTTDVLTSNITQNGWYLLEISNKSQTNYLLKATPQNQQATDDLLCATLTLTRLGEKGITGTGTIKNCW